MIASVDQTHDPALQSWVESANHPATDFPIQNLPFGHFRRADDMDWRIGVAIGDQVLDLRRARLLETHDMNRLMRLLPDVRQAMRLAISQGLRRGSAQEAVFREALVPQVKVRMGLPCEIGDYTDFYTGIHHATTVGKLFRPDNPLPAPRDRSWDRAHDWTTSSSSGWSSAGPIPKGSRSASRTPRTTSSAPCC